MRPMSLLKTAEGHPMLVELKNGETYYGHLVICDFLMNVHLREVICTSKDGNKFWRMAECYIQGKTVKSLLMPDEVIDEVQEETRKNQAVWVPSGVGRGRGRGRGGASGRHAKDMGHEQDDESAKGFGGGRGTGGPYDGSDGGRGRRGPGRGCPHNRSGSSRGGRGHSSEILSAF